MRTSNPAMSDRAFQVVAPPDPLRATMTIDGTVLKTAVLILILLATAAVGWGQAQAAIITPSGPQAAWLGPAMLGITLAGLAVAIVTIVAPRFSPFTAPLYAAIEGLLVGGISALYEAEFAGIVVQAIGLTVGVLAALLVAYASRLVRPSENFKLGVMAATGGIALVYLATLGLGLFGVSVPYIHDSGPIGIGFSLVVVVVAALNLVLDFDFIEQGARRGAPKYMEWYGGFGLLVTLIWLYLEILHLLAKLRDRD